LTWRVILSKRPVGWKACSAASSLAGDFGVAIGGAQVGLAESAADDVDLGTGLRQVNSGGVPEDARADPVPRGESSLQVKRHSGIC
jgi:hypothetical protein